MDQELVKQVKVLETLLRGAEDERAMLKRRIAQLELALERRDAFATR